MPYWAKIIPLLLLLSGVIAWLGDELGRRLGKKKVRLFGLRPKKTSLIIATGAGVLTTAVSIGLMALVSENARIALVSLDLLKAEAHELRKETKDLSHLLKNSEKVRKEAKRREAAALREEKMMRTRLEKERGNAVMLSSELLNLKAEVHNTARLRDNMKKELDGTRKEIRVQKKEMAGLELQKNKMDKQMGALTREYLKQEKRASDLASQADKLKNEIASLQETLDKDRKALLHGNVIYSQNHLLMKYNVGAGSRGQSLLNNLVSTLGTLNQTVYEKGARYHGKQALLYFQPQIEGLMQNMEAGKPYVLRVFSATNTFEGQPVVAKFELVEDKLVFRKGQVIVKRKVVSRGSREESPEGILQEILIEGKRKALQSGLVPGPQGVGSVLASVMMNTAQEIKRAQSTVEVSLVARQDIYRGSPLEVDFRLKKLSTDNP